MTITYLLEACPYIRKSALGTRRFQRAVSARRRIACQFNTPSCRDCALEATGAQVRGAQGRLQRDFICAGVNYLKLICTVFAGLPDAVNTTSTSLRPMSERGSIM